MRRHSYNIARHAHFLTFSCYRRVPILNDPFACRLLGDSLTSARDRMAFDLWAYVFMPDHVHLLLRPRQEQYSMAEILRHIKAPFARRLIDEWRTRHPERLRCLRVEGPQGTSVRVWQRGGGFDRNLYSPQLIRRAVEYIEWNPVRRGLVAEPWEWTWSSARAWKGCGEVPIRIDAINWDVAARESKAATQT